jgi:hypothetical protein
MMAEMPSMGQKEPLRVSKRDLEMLKYQRELMRKASLTGPSVQMMGTDLPMVRSFAQETFMQMSNMNPQQFKGKTVMDWEKAIKTFISSRRPEFREEILKKMRARYEGKGGEAPNVLLSKAMEEVEKKAEAGLIVVAVNSAFDAFGE